ncbi:MAG TPA: GvpL/GvpF family gas vesicle protein [Vicinamibacterales bacterium]
MIICVYALIRPAPARLNLTGVTGEKLRVVTVRQLSAVVGEMRRAPAPSVRNLRRYAAVVEAVAVRTLAILPARFGTTVADGEELRFVLTSRNALLRRRLRAVRSRRQMTLRFLGSDPDDAAFRGPTPVMPRSGVRPRNGATQGTQYLHRRRAMAEEARAIPGFEPIRAAVQRFVKDERVEKRSGVVTVNHLVPRTAVMPYVAAVRRAASDNHLRLTVSGPWAPYAFADNW